MQTESSMIKLPSKLHHKWLYKHLPRGNTLVPMLCTEFEIDISTWNFLEIKSNYPFLSCGVPYVKFVSGIFVNDSLCQKWSSIKCK